MRQKNLVVMKLMHMMLALQMLLEFIKAQKDISLSEITNCLKVSYKMVQRAVADLKELVLSKESEEDKKVIGR